MVITSSENIIVKDAMKLKQKKYRDEENKFVIEGFKMVSEIPIDWDVYRIIVSEKLPEGQRLKLDRFEKRILFTVSESIFKRLSDTEEPQGVMAICYKRDYFLNRVLGKEKLNIFILEEIQDPGNLGTIIRTADATKVDAILVSKKSADLYNPKTIRSTMASIFHIPIFTDIDIKEMYEILKSKKIKILATHLNTDKNIYNIKLNESICVVIGNESRGISDTAFKGADLLFKIPMIGQAESLNASIAASVTMYEILRQRMYCRQEKI
ncbi:MAG TPA: hypothetical protein DCP90_04350 [Clostridiales bacterium]|nr:MAG: hypothetical protein A2Y22_06915 [Clostridiales bacterium GWD2_32_59]HAN09826.1 hypothetical protein [Clostridiales bacterium]